MTRTPAGSTGPGSTPQGSTGQGSTVRQARRYLVSSLWILRDGLSGAAGRAIAIVISDVTGVALATASIAAVLLYARHAEHGEALRVLGRTWSTGSSRTLLAVAGGALLVGLLSAASMFWSELLTHRLARRYQLRCIRRVLRAASRADAGRIEREVAQLSGEPVSLAVLATSTSKYCAFALRSLIRTLLPALYTLVAAVALVRIDWRTTLALTGLGVFYFVPLVVINRRVATQHRRYREIAPSVQSGLRRGLRALLSSSSDAMRDERVWGPAIVDDPELAAMHDALYGRQMATKKVAVLNGTFFVLCLFAVLVATGLSSDEGSISWTMLLAYVVALRIAWTGIRQTTTSLVTMNRFFHEYDLFALFTEVLRRTSEPAKAIEPLAGVVDVPVADGTRLSLGPGTVTVALDASTGDRAGLERVADVLLATAPSVRRRIEDAPRPLAGATIAAQMLGLDGGAGAVEAARERLRRLDVLDEIEALPRGLDTPLATRTLERLSTDACCAIASGAAGGGEAVIVVQSLRGWRAMSPTFQQRLLRLLGDSALVVVDDSPAGILSQKVGPLRRAADQVVVLDEAGAARAGSLEWLEQHRDEVEAMLATRRVTEQEPEPDLDDDDDL